MSSHSVYDAYGAFSSTASPPDSFGYEAQAGYFTDNETGLVALAFRYYDPGTGRFLNRDPIGLAGGLNVYEYVGNGPSGGVDGTGYSGWAALVIKHLGGQPQWNGMVGDPSCPTLDFNFCREDWLQIGADMDDWGRGEIAIGSSASPIVGGPGLFNTGDIWKHIGKTTPGGMQLRDWSPNEPDYPGVRFTTEPVVRPGAGWGECGGAISGGLLLGGSIARIIANGILYLAQ